MTPVEVLRLIAKLSGAAADLAEGKLEAVDDAARTLHAIANALGVQDALSGYLLPEDARRILDEHERKLRAGIV